MDFYLPSASTTILSSLRGIPMEANASLLFQRPYISLTVFNSDIWASPDKMNDMV